MRFSAVLRSILALALLPQQALAASDCSWRVFSSTRAAVDRAFMESNMSEEQKLRLEAHKKSENLDAVDKQLKRLQDLTKIEESLAEIDQKNRGYQFEVLVLLDQIKTADSKYGRYAEILGRNYFQILWSQARIEHLLAQLKGSPNYQQIRADLMSEREIEKKSKRTYREAAKEALFPLYILDFMKSKGQVIDVTSAYKSARGLKDPKGDAIDTVEVSEPDARGGLESVQPESFTVRPAEKSTRGGFESLSPSRRPVRDSLRGIAGPTVDVPEDKSLTPDEIKTKLAESQEIKKRATAIAERFDHYYGTKTIIAVRDELNKLGVSSAKPTYKEFNELLKKMSLDPNSEDGERAEKQAQIKELRRLRWLSLVGGAGLSEAITDWVGGIKNKTLRTALQPVANLSGKNYDTLVQKRHGGKILSILANANPSNRIGELLRNGADGTYSNKKGELVVTFVRFLLPFNRDAWGEIGEC